MRDRPDGPELMDLVRRIEGGDTGVEVPGDARYRDLMLASARAIAERQRDLGDAPEQAERDRLREILDGDGTLADLNRDLAKAIRDGGFDANNEAVRRHLWQTALDRVRESNPKALKNQS
ncbi:MAG: hypothetical protein H8E39_04790 [Alphaproteobacteria bacterium]|nr:hypothetical protein [Alphaproteobacteria bacterium]